MTMSTLDMSELMVPLIVGGAVRWLVYTFLLWVMIKIQKIQYSGLGLLASSAAAVLTSFIPVVGPYGSYAVLLLCLWKATRASIAPDLIFTVVIAGALMFCVDLWALGMVMGKLGFDDDSALVVEAREGEPAPAESDEADSDGTDTALPGAETGTEPDSESAEPAQGTVQRLRVHPWGMSVRGITYSASRPIAMVEADQRIFILRPGEGFIFTNKQGRQKVRCKEITRSYVLLELNGNERVELTLD